jgi:hypothetical protein
MISLMPIEESVVAERIGEDGRKGYCVICYGEYGRIVLCDDATEAVNHRENYHPWMNDLLKALEVAGKEEVAIRYKRSVAERYFPHPVNREAVERISTHLLGESFVNIRAAIEEFPNGYTVVPKELLDA